MIPFNFSQAKDLVESNRKYIGETGTRFSFWFWVLFVLANLALFFLSYTLFCYLLK